MFWRKEIKQSLLELKKYDGILDKLLIEKKEINKIIKERTYGLPWLSEAISEYYDAIDSSLVNYLTYKSHPAKKASEVVNEIRLEKRILKKENFNLKALLNYYETLFPWLPEYVGYGVDDILDAIVSQDGEIEEEEDPVKFFVPKGEYEKLSVTVRNQLALERYILKKKSKIEIGTMYERYIGFRYEQIGYDVNYTGILEGLRDFGRDLVCTKDHKTIIVQCKNWSRHKEIHENHINQLFGTMTKYKLENMQQKVYGVFVTSTNLSTTAKKFADALKIKTVEGLKMDTNYPMIKCNVGNSGEKIYHLPFDQQYDKTKITNENEYYVKTVKEAENLGFRRAKRFYLSKKD